MNNKLTIYAVICVILLNLGVSLLVYKKVEANFLFHTDIQNNKKVGYPIGYPSLTASVTDGFKKNDVYLPGDKFTITASQAWHTSCANQNYNITVYLYDIDNISSYVSKDKKNENLTSCAKNAMHSKTASVSYTYTVPTVSGEHSIKISSHILNQHTCGDVNTWSGEDSQTEYYYFSTAEVNSVCKGGQVASGNGCACPSGQVLVNGSCVVSAGCGTANTVASLNFPTPSSSLCSVGYTSSNTVTSTSSAPHTWVCTAGTSTNNCYAPRCDANSSTPYYYAPSNICAADTCGGTCSNNQTCSSGTCVNNQVCTQTSINATSTPAFVANTSGTCSLSWKASNYTGGAVCTNPNNVLVCTVDGYGIAGNSATYSGYSISVGTHTLLCGDGYSTSTKPVKCKVSPSFREF